MTSSPTSTSRDYPRLLMTAFIALLPFLSIWLLPQIFFQKPVTDFYPSYRNDEVSNWRQIATAHAVGLEGGYFTVDEQPAASPLSRFYAHGPVLPLFYGTLGRLTGWGYTTGVFFNAFFISLALVFFNRITQLDRKQCLWLGVIYITSFILHLHIVSLMQEAFHHAAALVFAGIFYRLLRGDRLPFWGICLTMVFLLFMGMMRVSWMLLSLPLFLCLIPRMRIQWIVLSLVAAGGLTGGVYFLSAALSAPGSAIGRVLELARQDPAYGLDLLNRHIGGNFKALLQDLGYSLRGLQFLQILILLGAAYFYVIQRIRLRRGKNAMYWLFILYNLIFIVVLSNIVYFWGGFIRLFSVPLFMCVCLLLAIREYKFLAVMIALSLVGIGLFGQEFAEQHVNYDFTPDQMQTWAIEASEALAYQPNPPTPWCNTVLIDLILYDYHTTLLPPELGISWYAQFPEPMKSRYYYAAEPMTSPGLEELARFSFGGVVYENTQVRDQCLSS